MLQNYRRLSCSVIARGEVEVSESAGEEDFFERALFYDTAMFQSEAAGSTQLPWKAERSERIQSLQEKCEKLLQAIELASVDAGASHSNCHQEHSAQHLNPTIAYRSHENVSLSNSGSLVGK